MLYCQQTQNTLKISSGHSQTTFTVKIIKLYTAHRTILQYVTLMLDVYQVCHSVGCCVKKGLVFVKPRVKVDGQ